MERFFKARSCLSILVILAIMLFSVLEHEQSKFMFNYSPKENNITIVSPPLVRLYASDDTIAETNRCNQHLTNAIMEELREFWLSDFENRIIKSKESSTYHFVYHDVTFLFLCRVIRWNSDRQRNIDRLFTSIGMEWHCSKLFHVFTHIFVRISNGDCHFPLLSYMR